jgi:hypothetical protein
VGRLCERITRGCMAWFWMVGVTVDCGAGEVAGDGAPGVRLVVVGRVCERITRGCMALFWVVGVAVGCAAGEVAGDGGAAVRLVVVGRVCERNTRGCMFLFCMVSGADDCGAGEVAGDGLCGAAGLFWLGLRLRSGAWVASGPFGSCLVLGLLPLDW